MTYPINREHMVIARDGVIVSVRIKCPDHYAAVGLYDRLCAAAREGFLELELVVEDKPGE